MPHHHHRRRHGPRAFAPIVYEESVMLDTPGQIDALFVPPTDEPEPKHPGAGYVMSDAQGPDENMTRAAEMDRAISALMRDMSQNMNANQDFLNLGQDVVAFQADWAAWRKDHSTFFQMVGTEVDLNRFTDAFNVLRIRFQTITGKTPTAPGLQNPPTTGPFGSLSDSINKALMPLSLAALGAGYLIYRSFSKR